MGVTIAHSRRVAFAARESVLPALRARPEAEREAIDRGPRGEGGHSLCCSGLGRVVVVGVSRAVRRVAVCCGGCVGRPAHVQWSTGRPARLGADLLSAAAFPCPPSVCVPLLPGCGLNLHDGLGLNEPEGDAGDRATSGLVGGEERRLVDVDRHVLAEDGEGASVGATPGGPSDDVGRDEQRDAEHVALDAIGRSGAEQGMLLPVPAVSVSRARAVAGSTTHARRLTPSASSSARPSM